MMKRVVIALFLVLVVSAAAEAQICAGMPSFAEAPYQAGVSAGFREGTQGFGGRFAGGSSSLFAGGAVSILSFSEVESTQTNISAFAGADLGVDQSDRVFVCPIGSVAFGVGPDIGDVDVSTFAVQGGGSVGVVASSTSALMVVPTFGLAAGWQRASLNGAGIDTSGSDAFGVASLGVGLIFNRRIGIAPGISIPFSVADSEVAFTIDFTFNFGR
jgi:hypothetical protein